MYVYIYIWSIYACIYIYALLKCVCMYIYKYILPLIHVFWHESWHVLHIDWNYHSAILTSWMTHRLTDVTKSRFCWSKPLVWCWYPNHDILSNPQLEWLKSTPNSDCWKPTSFGFWVSLDVHIGQFPQFNSCWNPYHFLFQWPFVYIHLQLHFCCLKPEILAAYHHDFWLFNLHPESSILAGFSPVCQTKYGNPWIQFSWIFHRIFHTHRIHVCYIW